MFVDDNKEPQDCIVAMIWTVGYKWDQRPHEFRSQKKIAIYIRLN